MYYNALSMLTDDKEDCARHIILINVFYRNFDCVSIGSVNFILGATLFFAHHQMQKGEAEKLMKIIIGQNNGY